MKKVMIIALILVGALLIPAVSAEVLYDEKFDEYEFTGGRTVSEVKYGGAPGYLKHLKVDDIAKLQDLQYIALDFDRYINFGYLDEGTNEITYTTSYDSTEKQATVQTTYYRNLLGNVIHSRHIFYFPDWDIGSATGSANINIPRADVNINTLLSEEGDSPVLLGENVAGGPVNGKNTVTVASGKIFKNNLLVSENKRLNNLNVKLTRIIDGKPSVSTLTVYNGSEVVYNDYSSRNVDEDFLLDRTTLITLTNGDKIYEYPIGDIVTSPTTDFVTVYVRNSQTGALISGAHILIEGTPTTSDWIEYVNETLLSGTAQYNLPGMPYQYRIVTTADGYYPAASQYFRAGKTVIVDMEPYLTAPVNESNTYLEFYTRDMSANPIGGAIVAVDDQWLYTNNNGYARFEVAKNASYPYNVTKTGYLTIEGIATVGSYDRYVVNVALMAGAVPTHPTVSPTITVEPTPTQTTPPIQEDNIIGLSVKGLAKGFGIDYDTALLMFGLMIIFGAGGMVMSSVKGGAMEFIAGSIVGTFVAFALGLIPIWIFIIIAVVFGAYVLRVFVQGSQ